MNIMFNIDYSRQRIRACINGRSSGRTVSFVAVNAIKGTASNRDRSASGAGHGYSFIQILKSVQQVLTSDKVSQSPSSRYKYFY